MLLEHLMSRIEAPRCRDCAHSWIIILNSFYPPLPVQEPSILQDPLHLALERDQHAHALRVIAVDPDAPGLMIRAGIDHPGPAHLSRYAWADMPAP